VTPVLRPAASLLTACVLVAMAGCDSPTRPAPFVRPPVVPPIPTVPALELAGTYTLTIDIPDTCTALPPAERRRQYVATLSKSTFAYLTVRVVGGGYAEQTVVGEVWYTGQNPATIDWNNFDIGGCDGWLETLPGGDTLMICGNGAGAVDETSIVGTVSASAIVDSHGLRTSCGHPFLFTFLRQ
jgi:hypothetical protein